MKLLYVLRHAKADKSGQTTDDHERVLTQRGIEEARALGARFSEFRPAPEEIFCSTALRARETLENLVESAGTHPEMRFEKQLYLANPEDILRTAQGFNDRSAAGMVVGHNPGMAMFCWQAAEDKKGDAQAAMLHFPTCALACLSFPVTSWVDIRMDSAKIKILN